MKKGLRRDSGQEISWIVGNTDRPDEEGIKTDKFAFLRLVSETQTDLMKKGLRLYEICCFIAVGLKHRQT